MFLMPREDGVVQHVRVVSKTWASARIPGLRSSGVAPSYRAIRCGFAARRRASEGRSSAAAVNFWSWSFASAFWGNRNRAVEVGSVSRRRKPGSSR